MTASLLLGTTQLSAQPQTTLRDTLPEAVKVADRVQRVRADGYRIDPLYKVAKFHRGMVFASAIGTEVFVTGDGVVEKVEQNHWGYGNLITVNHGYGYKTQYAHLSKFAVKVGQKVKRGQVIGYVGNTGKSTGSHLHYEVLKNGEPTDPMHFFFNDLSPEEYEQILEQAQQPSLTMD